MLSDARIKVESLYYTGDCSSETEKKWKNTRKQLSKEINTAEKQAKKQEKQEEKEKNKEDSGESLLDKLKFWD